MDENKIRIAVLFGGNSSEHDVSCNSAAAIMANLDGDRYDVVPVKIERDGRWTVPSDDLEPGWDAARTALKGIPYVLSRLCDVDVVFPALHGPHGEDGTVQVLLENAGLPFVGNGVLASAVGMDKEFTKKLLAAAGLSVSDGVVLRRGGDTVSESDRARLGLPVFVKPARAGSSIGVSRVDSWDELPAALARARESDHKVLVEAAFFGREIDIGVLELPDGTVEVGPALEIEVPDHRSFFDYEAKYGGQGTIFRVPADVDAELGERLVVLARQVFEALECSGLLRIDFFVCEQGQVVVNEVNTFPGFTAASQYPAMWRAVGLTYPELLDTLIETALCRAGVEARLAM